MKKTLIALMALAGVSFGATPILDASFDGILPEGFNYTGESATFVDSGLEGYGQAIDFNKTAYLKTDTDCTDYAGITVGGKGTDFSIVTTVRFDSWAEASIGAPGGAGVENRLFICGSGTAQGNGIAWTVANGVMGITTKNKAHNPLSNPAITLNTETWYTLALTYNNESGVASFYVNGALAGTLTLGSAAVNDTTGTFSIGGGNLQYAQAIWDGAMADFKIYDATLTADEVAAFGAPTPAASPIVPEPATATLSLLALAGLAARRRRK